MLGVACVLLCACAVVLGQRLDLYEGDVCKQVRGTIWTCKALKNCPKAQQDLKNGRRPQLCNFAGSDSVVCCQPGVSPRKFGVKAKEKCKKYGESVYSYLEDPGGQSTIRIDHCANVEPLVTNGKDAESREYPHMALIGYGKKGSVRWLCGGSLISERFVLSAAHCTDGGKGLGLASRVRLGDYNKESTEDEKNGLALSQEYEIIERFDHPEYQSSSLYNDITLYKLNTDVEFNEFIRPICLQTDHQFSKTYAIVTGWGRTEHRGPISNILQKGNVTIIQRKQCSDAFKDLEGEKLDKGIVDASQLCAGDLKNQVDTCQGDSGGPLQIRLVEPFCMYSQVGITSFGVECGKRYPGVYTRVSYYVPWIEKIVWP